MGKRKSSKKTPRRNTTPKVQPKRGRTASVGRRTPFSSLIVHGVKSFISSIPLVSFIDSLVDAAFSRVQFTKKVVAKQSGSYLVETNVYGLSSLSGITYANILTHSNNVARDLTSGATLTVESPYYDAKLCSVKFTLQSQLTVGTRGGKWAAAFIPCRNDGDVNAIASKYVPMTIAEVERIPGCVSVAAHKMINLSYTPKPLDGYIYQYNPISAVFGYIVVAFAQEIRESYVDFPATAFAPDITMSGSIMLREPVLGGGVQSYKDVTWKAPTNVDRIFLNAPGLGSLAGLKTTDLVGRKSSQTQNTDSLSVTYDKLVDRKDYAGFSDNNGWEEELIEALSDP